MFECSESTDPMLKPLLVQDRIISIFVTNFSMNSRLEFSAEKAFEQKLHQSNLAYRL